jgi:isoleucyl-tRNA synthetase
MGSCLEDEQAQTKLKIKRRSQFFIKSSISRHDNASQSTKKTLNSGPMSFPEYGTDYSFAALEEKILAYWKKEKIFERSLEKSKAKPSFHFYDGPPFATGLPHYGHILAGTIKDIVPRYWSKRGFHVPRRFGWDCHGLPVEFEMEKTLNLNGSIDIQNYGVGKFNEACRGIVLRYAGEWRKSVERMGRWIDMDNDYKTMNPEFMETIWWVFQELWNKGLIYEGKKVVPYSWRLTAPLSNFEASLNYKDVQDPALSVLLPLTAAPQSAWVGNTALVIWTTTPWTLPSNLAVAAHPDSSVVEYARFVLPKPVGNITHVIMAKNLAEKFALADATEVVQNSDLYKMNYQPLFEVFNDEDRKKEKAFRVISADFVSATDGTGLVHMAPSFGEDDFFACQKAGISPVDPTDMEAKFTAAIKKDSTLAAIEGQFVKDADKHIIKVLKDKNLLLKQDTLQHAYPFCERSDTPLIYKAISSWFVKVENIKERMIKNNQQISWVPSHIKDGRFGKWLENARDWCISRNRFWGTPIPVWKCSACGHLECVGSRSALESKVGNKVPDIHKHFVDDLTWNCEKCHSAKSMKRTPEVLDCWFESGSMPFAQEHYPFENKKAFEANFPADFIAEGLDQTRGWFYTLTVLSTALFDKPAFKNCIVNGIVLAEDGRKMSKRLKNYPDPAEIFNKYGADALRLYLMQSPAMHAEDLRFTEKNLVELMRAVMLPLWNAYGFFASYANIDSWNRAFIKQAPAEKDRTMLDQWILARLKQTEQKFHSSMESYKLHETAPLLISFIEDLTNWYIRMNRQRFWGEGSPDSNSDKNSAYSTLWTVLDRFSELLAPGMPFLSETMKAALSGVSIDALSAKHESIHEKDFAFKNQELNREELHTLDRVATAQKIILLGRKLRSEVKINVRQPLAQMKVAGLSDAQAELLGPVKPLIQSELNIKELLIVHKAADLVVESAKPNFRAIGKKVGKDMKAVQEILAKWGTQEIADFEKNSKANVLGYELTHEEITIHRQAQAGKTAAADFGLVAELDTVLTEALIDEGLSREIINRIQQRRKETKLNLADRIEVVFEATPGSRLEKVLQNESLKASRICAETLCTKLLSKSGLSGEYESFDDLGNFRFEIKKI